MNDALDRLAGEVGLADQRNERLRLEFSHACVLRIEHLLEDAEVRACLNGLGDFLAGTAGREELDRLAAEAARLANHHPGSHSIDGCGHAAVSATYGVARALAGTALEAASYAAYATVYAQGGAAAVAERASFDSEFAWQVAALRALAAQLCKNGIAFKPDEPTVTWCNREIGENAG